MTESKDSHRPPSGPSPRRRIDSLTGLRGCAAIWVLVHNDQVFRETVSVDAYTSVLAKGYLAVDFFLMLSGFVLAYVHAAEFRRWDTSRYWHFLALRLARIYPLYLFLLGVRVAIEMAKYVAGVDPAHFDGPLPFTETNSPTALLANAAMVQAWGGYSEATWVPTFWSVSAEWFAYLVFPALMIAGWRMLLRPLGSYAWLIACATLLAVAIQVHGNIELPVQFSLVRCMPEFALGIWLARSFVLPGEEANQLGQDTNPTGGGLWRAIESPQLVWLSLGILVCWMHFGLHDLLPIVLMAILIHMLARDSCGTRPLARILESRPLVFLGEISYAVYLSHLIIQSGWKVGERIVFGGNDPRFAVLSLGVKILLTLVVSTLLYKMLEVPARRFCREKADEWLLRARDV